MVTMIITLKMTRSEWQEQERFGSDILDEMFFLLMQDLAKICRSNYIRTSVTRLGDFLNRQNV